MMAFQQYFVTEPRFFHEVHGLAKSQIGLLLAINPVLIVLLEMPLVHALRGRNHLHMIALGAVLLGASWPLLLLESAGLAAIVMSLVVLTFGEMLFWPLMAAFVSDVAPVKSRGRYMGAYGATFSGALVISPLLGGQVYEHYGPGSLWLTCLLLSMVAAALSLLLLRLYRRQT